MNAKIAKNNSTRKFVGLQYKLIMEETSMISTAATTRPVFCILSACGQRSLRLSLWTEVSKAQLVDRGL